VLQEIPIGLEVLDALVERYLSEFAHVWVDFDREPTTLGSVTYGLRHEELGDLATITLYSSGEQKSTMKIHKPVRWPDRDLTPEEQKDLAAISDRKEKLKAHTDLREKIRAEREEVYLKRKKRHQRATEALFQGLNLDRAWRVAMQGVTTTEGAIKKPDPPSIDAPSDEWFEWFHLVTDKLGFKMNLKELALKMGLSHDYVRHLHMDYMAEHGGRKRHRMTQE